MTKFTHIVLLLMLSAQVSRGQQADDASINGRPLDNAIADRSIAVRIRGEAQMTDDDTDLIETDVNYARFPSRMYDGEIRVMHERGASISADYSVWDSEQNVESTRQGFGIKMPVSETINFNFKYRVQDGGQSLPDYRLYYLGFTKSWSNGLYSSTQYRNRFYETKLSDGSINEQTTGHQLTEYLSYSVSKNYRIGMQVSASYDEAYNDAEPWYGRVFGTKYLMKDLNSIRIDAQYYKASKSLDFTEVRAYFYQKLSRSTYLRLGYRNYTDSQDLSSDSYGIFIKHFFSASFQLHAGYRFYEHSTGEELDSVYAGFNLIF